MAAPRLNTMLVAAPVSGHEQARMSQELPQIGEINALLGRGTEYDGKLCFEGRVRIDGRFRGAIHSDDTLIVGEGAEVDADVHVARLIVRGGVLRGSVHASEVIEVFAPAKVYADLVTPALFLDRGAVFEGRCTMDGGSEVASLPLDEASTSKDARVDARESEVPIGLPVDERYSSLPPPGQDPDVTDTPDPAPSGRRRRRRR